MFGLFFKKRVIEQIKKDTKDSFDSVKRDITHIGDWIKHLDSEKNTHKKDIKDIKDILSSVQEEIEELKNIFSVMNSIKNTSIKQTNKQVFNKQTPVAGVQTNVQTSVQTPNLNQFSITERAIIWTLLNTDMNLSYEDLSAVLGKEKSTIRGQINTIKQKSTIIYEKIEKNGKKRLYIPNEIKEKMLKKSKVRVKKIKTSEN